MNKSGGEVMPEPAALAGIRVLDFTTAGAGLKATSQLGFLGAEVLKLEPPEGNSTLRIRPTQGGIGAFYTAVMPNKKSAFFDAKKSSQAQREDLINWADVFIQNIRPGSIEGLGFGYEACRAINPGIVHVSITAFGNAGPLANRSGTDQFAQAHGGWMSYNGKPGGPPEFSRQAGYIDHLAGSFAAAAAMIGLSRREEEGVGSQYKVTLLGSVAWAQMHRVAQTIITDRVPRPEGSRGDLFAPDWAVRCGDAQQLAILARTQDEWAALCGAIEAPDLLADPRFIDNPARVRHREALEQALAPIFDKRAAYWWVLQLTRANVPHALAQTYPLLKENAQIVANGYVKDHLVPGRGRFTLPEPPWKLSRSALRDELPPRPGQDTAFLDELDRTRREPPQPKARPPRGWLSGLTVGDATQGIAGPLGTSLYAALGATVRKFEPPGGDYLRLAGAQHESGTSIAYLSINAGKQLATGPFDPSELDVLFLDQDSSWLGLDVGTLQTTYPKLVICRITANGPLGPRSGIKGGELTSQVQAEFHVALGVPEDPLERVGTDIVSASTALASFQGTLAALWERRRSGKGQLVDLSMLGVALFARVNVWSVLGEPDEWVGHLCEGPSLPPQYGYTTKDGLVYFNFQHTTEAQYIELLTRLGALEEALADERWDIEHGGRNTVGTGLRAPAFTAVWSRLFSKFSSLEVQTMINDLGGNAVSVNDLGQLIRSDQIKALGSIAAAESSGVEVPIVCPPLTSDGGERFYMMASELSAAGSKR